MSKKRKRLNNSSYRPVAAGIFRRSFTVLEIIIVIVVVGIVAAIVLPRFQRNDAINAAKQILSHIRYTQHLALIDDKYDPKKKEWYKELWQIRFFKKEKASSDGHTAKWAYAVFSDKDSGSGYDGNPNATTGEVALEPLTKKLLSGGFTIDYSDSRTFKKAAIEETYNVVDVRFASSCSYKGSRRIVFDNYGRPLKGDPQSYTSLYQKSKIIREQCIITFCLYDSSCNTNFKIAIEPESGYAFIYAIHS